MILSVVMCFERNDTYTKAWLELLFLVYLFVIISIIITISKYYKCFSYLIGKNDPIATMATMILLSYTKLLRSTITMLSIARLEYTNSSGMIYRVWLLDGNIPYHRDGINYSSSGYSFHNHPVLLAVVSSIF